MKPKLIAILLLIVLLPLGLLAWLGLSVARDEQEIVQNRFRKLLAGRLSDVDVTISGVVGRYERDLSRLTDGLPREPAAIRALVRKTPVISQIFVLDPEGRRVHPAPAGPLSSAEREFLERAGQVWEDKRVFYHRPEENYQQKAESVRWRGAAADGWYTWYWGAGLNFIFWQRDAAGNVIGVELNRARLLADIVAALPHAGPLGPGLAGGRIRLVNAGGATLHQWGSYSLAEAERPAVSRPVCTPLCAWELQYFASGAEFSRAFGGGVLFNFIAGLTVIALAMVALSVYFYRESSREMREARQRVSFVNQVSHELKTPLTNIRMYAELLEDRLEGEDERAGQHLGVIVSESQRLSRLIANVLTFARQQRNKLSLHLAERSIDDVIRSVIDNFRPSLEAKGVDIVFSEGAGELVKADADVVEQILGNLFGNVEKYAASGGLMNVTSERDGDRTIITVADRGPGIPRTLREKIFDPFCRASNKLTEGAAGTGIGLAIARDLARLHGGDVTLDAAGQGASFKVVLHTPPTERGGHT
ncbi:MAG: ATP-binding protein [Planctomycetota bacterium]